jgi:hypothetical protein
VLVRELRGDRAAVIHELAAGGAVFALDTAARMRGGIGLLHGDDVHVHRAGDPGPLNSDPSRPACLPASPAADFLSAPPQPSR